MDWTEVAGFVTGAACVALVVRRSVWNFPAGIANNLLFLVLVVAATWAIWSLLTRHTDSDVPTWDALTRALSLVAQLTLSFKWIGNWAFWIAAELVYVPLYLHKGLTLTAVLYAGFVALCAVGLRQWWRLRDAPDPVNVKDDRPAEEAVAAR